MKISKVGLFKNQWMCWCVNTSKKKGFYPCNAEGKYQRDLWGRGKYYACAQCGRIIDPHTLKVVGLMRGHKVPAREVRDLIFAFQDEGIHPVGISLQGLLRYLTPNLRLSLVRLGIERPLRGQQSLWG